MSGIEPFTANKGIFHGDSNPMAELKKFVKEACELGCDAREMVNIECAARLQNAFAFSYNAKQPRHILAGRFKILPFAIAVIFSQIEGRIEKYDGRCIVLDTTEKGQSISEENLSLRTCGGVPGIEAEGRG